MSRHTNICHVLSRDDADELTSARGLASNHDVGCNRTKRILFDTSSKLDAIALKFGRIGKASLFVALLLWLMWCRSGWSQTPTTRPSNAARVLAIAGKVDMSEAGATTWTPAQTNQVLVPGDRLRTGEKSRATIRLADLSILRLTESTTIEIGETSASGTKATLRVNVGSTYLHSRQRPQDILFRTPVVSGAIRGTEFSLAVAEDGRTVLTLLDGEVSLENSDGTLELKSGEQAVVERGQAPRKTAVLDAVNIIQWALYYPGVIDPDELPLTDSEKNNLAESLAEYRRGDLLQALAKYPPARVPVSAGDKIYRAALLLAVGDVEEAQGLLRELNGEEQTQLLAGALSEIVAAVKNQTWTRSTKPRLAGEWMAESYYQQSRSKLEEALSAAQEAAKQSPAFGFAWARVAELEFSFGRVPMAERALDRALALSPRNAQAHALRGFLLLARDRTLDAEAAFAQAMQIDPMLGNAWLGRGLGRIHQNQAAAGRADLQTAASLEPTRSLLRSYLGKAFAHEALFGGDPSARQDLRKLAMKELDLAKLRDPLDPTPWLYAALLMHDEYRTAEAIHDLEESERLNGNRQVYRSRLLLDQDQAVRSANLANIFDDAGMTDLSVRESARAVSFDYGNYSAHLNLASSFNALRDPTRFNLRYESEWFNEHLLASLLAPVGAGSLSQNLSQQEYSRLFGTKQFGISGTTEYFSNHELRQVVSQFGTIDHTSYALDLEYQYKEGIRPNNDLSRVEWYSRIKQQLSPQDSLFVLVKYQDYDAGDNFQYYNPASARPNFRFQETQTPLVLGGWHHEWSPGVHTLVFGGRLENDQNLSDRGANQFIQIVNPVGVLDPMGAPFDVTYRSQFEIFSGELNQIFQRPKHTDIWGVRYQAGDVKADARLDNPPATVAPLVSLPALSAIDADFQRFSAYAYHHWEIADGLMLIGGLTYDDLKYPANFRRPPLNGAETKKERWSPKAGLIWQATPALTLRGIYSRATGGLSYDESVRLEPTQIAGFGQSFRSIISESLVGSVEAPDYEIGGGALDLKLRRDSWLSFQGETVLANVERRIGLFSYNFFGAPPITQSGTVEHLDYQEWKMRAIFNQIWGKEWFLQAQYQWSRSELNRDLPSIAATPAYARRAMTQADFHEIQLAATWRSRAGFFAKGEFWWFLQELDGSTPQPPGDHFPQLNFYAGYRFPNRRGEVSVGVMNVTGEDYRLSPLNYYLELPRERLFYTRIRFNF